MWSKVTTISLLAALVVYGSVAVAAPKTKGSATVAKDPAGDWGAETSEALAPAGDALGQDLVAARITNNTSTVDFSFVTTSLPEEAGRLGVYAWDMRVDGQWWRLVNFPCDPTQYVTDGTPPVEAPESCAPETGEGTFFEIMECGDARVVNIFANCAYRSSAEAQVDTANATITVPVPKELMKIRSGTVIAPMDPTNASIGSALGFPYEGAPAFPADEMLWKKPYRVP